jgi:hypothetical protein
VVDLPTHISSSARPRMRLFSAFLQGVGRTTAGNRLDPSLSSLASADVLKYVQSLKKAGSVQTTGSVKYSVSKVQAGTTGIAVISGCVDQSKLVQVREDGSHYQGAEVKKSPTLKMNAEIKPSGKGPRVTAFSVTPGTC